MLRRRIIFVGLIAAVAVIALLVTSMVVTGSHSSEVREAVRMQSFAAFVTGKLGEHFRQHKSYPEELSGLTWSKAELPPGLGFSTNDLPGFRYDSDGRSYRLKWESKHYGFWFSATNNQGTDAKPIARK